MSPHANRGNVAIIVWNTLEAPYVWDVNSTEYEGTINLGNSTRSLLSIYFRDYVYTNTDTEKEYFKEATVVTVAAAPSMNKELGSRQIVLNPTNSKEFAKFKDDFETSAPRKNEEEATWLEDGKITAYVPEEVCADLESLYGKEVTVIFGDENVVASIRVTNDSFVDNEFVEKVDIANDKITVAGTAYKLYKNDTEIYVNGIPFGKGTAQLAKVIEAIGCDSTSTRSLTKALKANVILDSKNKVDRLDLTISGEYYIDADTDEFVTSSDGYEYEIQQYVVENIKAKGDVIAVGVNGAIFNYKDLIEDDQEPKVVKDSKEISLEEIAKGDVLTVITDKAEAEIRTIYVSSEKVEGEVTVKSTLDVTINGEKYLANKAAKMTLTGELKEATTEVTYTELKKVAKEDVEIYLNILGEYVALVADSSAADGIFGVVTKVSDIHEDKDDDYAEYRSIWIMTADGEDVRYELKYDEKTDKTSGANEYKLSNANGLENKLITFKADSNKKILIEDITVAETGASATEGYVGTKEGTVIVLDDGNTVNFDKKRVTAGDKEYGFTGAKFLNYNSNDEEVKVLGKGWKSLVSQADTTVATTKLGGTTLIVVDEDDDVLLVYSKVNTVGLLASDDIFAVISNIDHKDTGKETVTVKTVAGEEETYEAATKNLLTDKGIEVADFVMFNVKDGKINDIAKLFDVIAMNDLNDEVKINHATCTADACNDADHIGRVVTTPAVVCDCGVKEATVTDTTSCPSNIHTAYVAPKYSCLQGLRVNTTAKLSDGTTPAILTGIIDNDTTKENLVFEFNANREDRLYYTDEITSGTTKVSAEYINNENLVIIDLSNMDEDCEGIEFVNSLEEIDGEVVIAITINDDSDSDDEGAEILVVIK